MDNILTKEDIEFLKNLAHELKTQDRMFTGKPVVLQIREEDMITGIDIDYAEDICLIDTYGDVSIYTDVDEVKEYFNDYFDEDDLNENILDEINNADELEDVLNILEQHDKDEGWVLTGYQKQHKYSNFFLTKKALDRHVKQNYYHYNEPDYFINHAWRNPELERLLEIVEKFDVE